jgi:hypothetical protein
LIDTEPGMSDKLVDFLHVHDAMWDKSTHNRLQNYLVHHMWNHVGNR